jgi:hypothetical protein
LSKDEPWDARGSTGSPRAWEPISARSKLDHYPNWASARVQSTQPRVRAATPCDPRLLAHCYTPATIGSVPIFVADQGTSPTRRPRPGIVCVSPAPEWRPGLRSLAMRTPMSSRRLGIVRANSDRHRGATAST